ncbi:AAA family ATPase [Mycobacterium sp. E2479]|uniref:AAA family ATPase n=1 Tax=Mycobacterium sp. E2479 TaxID=1834134 RepID=UPI000800279E|nr:AAA family ATPase [Mycobacterium sp. E2479]OBH55468.1 hypothetical protein A5686_06405 [Mycobacterium sp. E2479]
MSAPPLTEVLGYAPGEHISLNHQPNGGEFSSQIAPVADIGRRLAELPRNVNVWFGVNPIRANVTGRGGARDITRLAALYAEFDLKPGGCPNLTTVHAIIGALSELVGTAPSALIHSGHGIHAYWPIEDGHISDAFTITDAQALLRRFGRLVAAVAARHNANVDNVFDLARVLRVPGTVNHKNDPAPVQQLDIQPGAPLTVAEADERLNEAGIYQTDSDARDTTTIVAAPDSWPTPPEHTCSYTATMADGWATDTPRERHPWFLSSAIRLECARRYGCITPGDYQAARQRLEQRFHHLLKNGEPQRQAGACEIDDMWKEAINRAACKTSDAFKAELGAHEHHSAASTIDAPGQQPTPRTVAEQAGARPRIWQAGSLKSAAAPRWLAQKRIPQGQVSVLVGDEGIGKSLFWVWIIAHVTTGRPLPEFGIPARKPGVVLIVITEDAWETDVLPRLDAAGADLDNVRVLCEDADGSGAPIFPRDFDLIRGSEEPLSVIVVDAWLDTVAAGLEVRDTQQARQALHPWKEIAATTDAAVLLVAHTNRVASGSARDRIGATAALRQKARMLLLAQLDEDDKLTVGPEKANGVRTVTAAAFTTTGVQYFKPTDDHDGTVPVLTYTGDTGRTAKQIHEDVHAAQRQRSKAAEPDDEVSMWLRDAITATERCWAAPAYDEAEMRGWSTDKVKRAKKKLGVIARKDEVEGRWYWTLPGQGGAKGADSALYIAHPRSLAPFQVAENGGAGARTPSDLQGSGQVFGPTPSDLQGGESTPARMEEKIPSDLEGGEGSGEKISIEPAPPCRSANRLRPDGQLDMTAPEGDSKQCASGGCNAELPWRGDNESRFCPACLWAGAA